MRCVLRPLISTPWGVADSHTHIAEGIEFYGTPSHGGMLITPERRRAMPKAIAEFKTFTGGNWYEEDFDVNLVVYSFPEAFDPECAVRAEMAIRACHPELLPAK